MADIKKELNDIKNAVYGREVRGSIHDGIKKINEESEGSRQIANSIEQRQDAVEQQFDDVLNEWTSDKPISNEETIAARTNRNTGENHQTLGQRLDAENRKVNAQLADNVLEINNLKENTSLLSDIIYKKEIVLSLPIRFPDYDDMDTFYGGLYPQSFSILKEDDLIFINYSKGNDPTNCIVVYQFTTGEYISCFRIAANTQDGLVVKKEGEKRYLYGSATSEVNQRVIRRFDITNLPQNKSLLTDYTEINVQIASQFNYHNGKWITMQNSVSAFGGGRYSRNYWQILDDDFNVIKSFYINGNIVPIVTDYDLKDIFPKTQSIAIGSDFIALGIGAFSSTGDSRNKQQGLLIVDFNGNVINEGILSSEGYRNQLVNLGYSIDHIENEGVFVDENDNIYSLIVHKNYNAVNGDEVGILIFKEASTSKDAIDFKNISTPLYTLDVENIAKNMFPVMHKKDRSRVIENPITNERFNTVFEIFDFMVKYKIPHTKFYFDSVTGKNITGLRGEEPVNTFYLVYNLNNNVIRGFEVTYNEINSFHYLYQSDEVKYIRSDGRVLISSDRHNLEEGTIIQIPDITQYKYLEFEIVNSSYDGGIYRFDLSGATSTITSTYFNPNLTLGIVYFKRAILKKGEDILEVTSASEIIIQSDGTPSQRKISDGNFQIRKIYGVL